jgi:hypothetical protein
MAVSEIGEEATGISGDVASQSDLDRVYESVKHMAEKSTWSSRNAGITQLAPFGMRVLTQRLLRSIRGGPYEHR